MSTTAANQAIYDRLHGMQQFHPGTATLLSDWTVEPGDVIEIQNGTDENGDPTYQILPVYQLDMTWNGACMTDIQATGNEKRPPLSALRRSTFSAGRGGAAAERKADEALEEVLYTTDFTKTDRGIGMLAQAIGVKVDENTGLPAKDEHGEYLFDGVDGATLTGTLSVQAGNVIAEVQQARGNSQTLGSALSLKADTATLISAINSASGTIASGKVQVQPGNVLIEAINNGDGTVTISADKVNINGDTVISWLTSRSVDVATLQASSSLTCTGDTTINNVEVTGTLTIPSSGQASYQVTADNLVKSLAITPPASGSSDYTLTWTTADGVPHTLTFSRAAQVSNVSGTWSGSTYTVAADASGTALPKSVTIDAILAGGGTADFSAQIRDTSSGQSPVIIDSDAAHGYLAKSGNSVVVYTSRSGSTYSGPVASLSFQSEINTAATNAKNTALAGVKLSGWQCNSSSHNAENIVRDVDNNDLNVVASLPPSSDWRVDVGAFNSSGSAIITVTPVLGGVSCNPVTTSTISDSNLLPENIKSGVTIFGKTGTYTGSGGPSVSSVGLYFDNEGLEDVTTPFSVDNDYTVYPIAKMSDGTRRVGSAVRLTTTISLYDVGTITPTSSAQTIAVPTGYAGFAGPLRIAAASGGSSYSYSAKLNRNSELYIKDGSSYYPLSALNLYGYTSANTYTQIPSGTTVHW